MSEYNVVVHDHPDEPNSTKCRSVEVSGFEGIENRLDPVNVRIPMLLSNATEFAFSLS
jgi:hypothetical protein